MSPQRTREELLERAQGARSFVRVGRRMWCECMRRRPRARWRTISRAPSLLPSTPPRPALGLRPEHLDIMQPACCSAADVLARRGCSAADLDLPAAAALLLMDLPAVAALLLMVCPLLRHQAARVLLCC